MSWICGKCDAENGTTLQECAKCQEPKVKPLIKVELIVLESNKIKVNIGESKTKELRELKDDVSNHLYPQKEYKWHSQKSMCSRSDLGKHTTESIQAAQIKQEKFIDDFHADPLKVYLDLQKRAKKDANFAFGELDELFQNMKRVLVTLQQRVCCGEKMKNMLVDSWSPSELRKELLGPVPGLMMKRMDELAKQGYPYQDCMRFCLQFAKVMDYIVYRAKTEWELEGYKVAPTTLSRTKIILKKGLISYFDTTMDTYSLSDRIDAISGAIKKRKTNALKKGTKDKSEEGRVGTRFEQIKEFDAGFSCFPPKNTLAQVYELVTKSVEYPFDTGHYARTDILPDILNTPEIIIVPTYNYLGSGFFSRIRSVPMCVIGMIDTEFIAADAICMSPLTFFDHDMFHVFGYPGRNSAQLWHTIQFRTKILQENVNKSIKPEDLYKIWDKNAKTLKDWIDSFDKKDRPMKWALNLLVFFALHEPASLGDDGSVLNPPALVEPSSIRARMLAPKFLERLILRAKKGDFGRPPPKVQGYIQDQAFKALLAKLDELDEDPGKGKYEYATKKGDSGAVLPKPIVKKDEVKKDEVKIEVN